mmetsp:Transcript_20801/g.53074  ORF Transcript_20801/g.53074 Transcript_20801/m.53074 type:complete len:109 (-) Transcript_20801:719-1045(-)
MFEAVILLAAGFSPCSLKSSLADGRAMSVKAARVAVLRMGDEPTPERVQMKGMFDFEAMSKGIFGGVGELNPVSALTKLFKGEDGTSDTVRSAIESPIVNEQPKGERN